MSAPRFGRRRLGQTDDVGDLAVEELAQPAPETTPEPQFLAPDDAGEPATAAPEPAGQPAPKPRPAANDAAPAPRRKPDVPAAPAPQTKGNRARIEDAYRVVRPLLMDFMDVAAIAKLSTRELTDEITDVVPEICIGQGLQINVTEQRELTTLLLNEMLGLGPIEPLLADESISEIMINGPNQIYIERAGVIELTDVRYENDAHLMNAATRIVSRIGRRVDESSPMCDARLGDGSRVNVIIPPLALRGPTITIRKFKKDKLTLEKLVEFGTLCPRGAAVLKIIGASRCNILISGGTGSGKTTLLNCLTRYIHEGERVITCEDAAELQLQQPHWVPLETRPPNIEGFGQVTMRDLVRNCLRMRPERIIVGEVRGPEAFDLLQAMNTGHDGSMGTLHANTPREAISRIENMVAMASLGIPAKAVRDQISTAIHVIVQIQRLRDGSRRITHITEVMGSPGDDVVTMQDLYVYKLEGEDAKGRIVGKHAFTGLRPAFWDKARYFGLERELANALDYRLG